MPVYDVAAAAEALGVSAKQVDNILSRNSLPGVEHKRRGVSRRITPEAVVTLSIILELGDALGLPVPSAFGVAQALREHGGVLELGPFARISVDFDALHTSTVARLDAAVEAVGRRPRGRRPKRRHPTEAVDAVG
ncbi:MAG TPA: hypothetical protein VFZ21_29385 [Gemmatimonadaceae bacterium]|jgi:hypothetical protein|nr:hypothetical protein [Gemmatimonadaceae bacterium]